MKTAIIVIGHSARSRGASNKASKMSEWEYNNEIAKGIHSKLMRTHGIKPILVYRTTGYSALPYQINIHNPDVILSLHCNAFDEHASGCEMLYYHSSKEAKHFASILQSSVVKVMKNKNRGLKPKHSEDRGGHILKSTNAPCVIAEPFFIDNNKELQHAMKPKTKRDLIDAYTEAIKQFVR